MANYQTLPQAIAGADISANQFEAVKMGTADNTVIAIAATTDRPVGILANDPDTSGKAAEVVVSGIVLARYGATIARGAALGVDADGELVTLTPGSDTTRYVFCTALESGVNGDVRPVLVGYPHRGA